MGGAVPLSASTDDLLNSHSYQRHLLNALGTSPKEVPINTLPESLFFPSPADNGLISSRDCMKISILTALSHILAFFLTFSLIYFHILMR